MNTICLFTQSDRLSQRWQDVLLKDYEVVLCKEFEHLKRLVGDETFVVFHDDRDQETVIKELDTLHEIYEKKNTIVLKSLPNLEEGELFLSHGIGGYGNSNMSDDVFLQAIGVVTSGNVWLYPELMSSIIKKINNLNGKKDIHELLVSLSEREKEVALLIAKGETNQMIADDLSISHNTVKLHITSIFEKLGIKSRVALAILLSKAS